MLQGQHFKTNCEIELHRHSQLCNLLFICVCIVEQLIRIDPDYNMIYNNIMRQLGDIEKTRFHTLKNEWKTMLAAFFMPRDGRLQHDDWIMMVSC